METAIVVNSFGRGGSNILINLIAASPDVQMAADEFWQFYYRGLNLAPKVYRRVGTRLGRVVSCVTFRGSHFRQRLAGSIARAVAQDLQLRNARNLVGTARIVLFKVTEYDIFLNREIERQFDKVQFIGLLRNGYSLCESWKRRGTPPKLAGRIFCHVAGRMLEESRTRLNYRIVRFEDITRDPLQILGRLQEELALTPPPERGYIYLPKGFGPGQERAAEGKRKMQIIARSDWPNLLNPIVDESAISRLLEKDIRDFNRHAAPVMEEFYSVVNR